MKKLTKKTYFSLANKCISNSKITDYLKDKNFFYRKHVLGNIGKKETPSMTRGSAVDFLITSGEKKFLNKYMCVARRSNDAPKGIIQLPVAEYEAVLAIATKVKNSTAFKELRGFKKQVILQDEVDLGQFEGICGALDFLKVDEKNKKAIIVDLKTAKDITPSKYFWHCVSYSYMRQLAMYGLLVQANYGIHDIEYRHLAVEIDADKIYKVQAFTFSKEIIEAERAKILETLADIKKELKFLPSDTSFKDAVVIGGKSGKDGAWGVEI